MSPLKRIYNIEKILFPERKADEAINEFENALMEIYLKKEEKTNED